MKFKNNLSILIISLSFVQLASSSEFPLDIESASCRDYTYDSCRINSDSILDSITGISEEDCQIFCSTIFASECQLFVYNRIQRECQILSQNLDTYLTTCGKISGPKIPKLSNCSDSDDSCTNLKEAFCILKGHLLENFEDIHGADLCQLACNLVDGCNHFVFDYDYNNCELLDSGIRECDLIVGLQQPSIHECYPSSSTTESPTTTSQESTTSLIDTTTPSVETTTSSFNESSTTTQYPETSYSSTDVSDTTTHIESTTSFVETSTVTVSTFTPTAESTTTVSQISTTEIPTTFDPSFVNLQVLVLDKVTSLPLQSVEVICSEANQKVLTDENGEAICGLFKEGSEVFIRLHRDGYEDLVSFEIVSDSVLQFLMDQTSQSTTTTSSPTTSSSTTLSPTTSTTTSRDVLVGISVRDASTGGPLWLAKVICTGSDIEVEDYTDEHGKANCGRFPGGSFVFVSVDRVFFEYFETSFEIQPSPSSQTFTVYLSPFFSTDDNLKGVLTWKNSSKILDLHVAEFAYDDSDIPRCEHSNGHPNCKDVSIDDVEIDDNEGFESLTWTQTSHRHGISVIFVQPLKNINNHHHNDLDQIEAEMIFYGKNHEIRKVTLDQSRHHHRGKYWIVGCLIHSNEIKNFHEVNRVTHQNPRYSKVCKHYSYNL